MPSGKETLLWTLGATTGLSVAAWRLLFPWIGYDIQLIKFVSKSGKAVKDFLESNRSFIDNFEDLVKKQPTKTCIIFEDRCYSYEFVNQQACKVADIVSRWRLRREDSVAIFIENSPDFVWIFFGLLKLGIITTLLNTNSKGNTIKNCLVVTEAKAVIIGRENYLLEAIDEINAELELPLFVLGYNVPHRYRSWDELMLTASPAEVCSTLRSHLNTFSNILYVFTSGTTGLPKAARIPIGKFNMFATLLLGFDVKPDDVLYDVLPLYHITGLAGLIGTINAGCAVVIRKRFSASHFFKDCQAYNVTMIVYIGELCRYLLALPEGPDDKKHKIRVIAGNGLRKDIWNHFKERFNIPFIMEFFGASEATTTSVNIAGRPGAVGRISPLMNKIDPAPKFLVKYDFSTAQPLRNKEGKCTKVDFGEPGLFIAGIPPLYQHGFYKGSKELTEKKIVRNVFKDGDEYFNFGDLMYMDKDYFLYFHDRIGDTFRWKGENVSTTEVANIMTMLPFIQDANVYGVEIPGHDGRAGMASLTFTDSKHITSDNMKKIYQHCKKHLPIYSIPLILRVEKETRITATFKQHKVDLVKEGYDPNMISDPLFYMCMQSQTYLPLSSESLNSFLQSRL